MGQDLAGDDARVTIMTDETADDRPVLLLDPGLVVFSISP